MTRSAFSLFLYMCLRALLIGAGLGMYGVPLPEAMPALVLALGLHLLWRRSGHFPTPYPRRNKGVQL